MEWQQVVLVFVALFAILCTTRWVGIGQTKENFWSIVLALLAVSLYNAEYVVALTIVCIASLLVALYFFIIEVKRINEQKNRDAFAELIDYCAQEIADTMPRVEDYRKQVYHLSPTEFRKCYRRYCAYLLEKDGWEVKVCDEHTNEKVVDLYATDEWGRLWLVKCEPTQQLTDEMIRDAIERVVYERSKDKKLFFSRFYCPNISEQHAYWLDSRGVDTIIADYDNKYPCVKCIAASGLYYMPQHRDYDAIAFSIHRGDRHCYDEAEAERLGFNGDVFEWSVFVCLPIRLFLSHLFDKFWHKTYACNSKGYIGFCGLVIIC